MKQLVSEFRIYPSRMAAYVYFFHVPVIMGGFILIFFWSQIASDHPNFRTALMIFIGVGILQSLHRFRVAYMFQLDDDKVLRCIRLFGTSKYPLEEIQRLKLSKSWTEEDQRDIGIIEPTKGKITTFPLSELQSKKLRKFFASIVKLDPRIKLELS